jgi:hypothetical protein
LLDIAIDLINTVVDLLPASIELVLCFIAEVVKLVLALLDFSTGFGDLEVDS